jgi:hypothetical protein
MNETRIDINALRLLYEWHYNPATDLRSDTVTRPTAAWREIARLAGFNKETDNDERIIQLRSFK